MAKNFPELIKDTKHRFKKHYEPRRTSIEKPTFKLIWVNLPPHSTKKKEKILKQLEKKDYFQRSNNKIDSCHLSRNSESQKILGYFLSVKENNCQCRILYPVTRCFKIEDKSHLTITISYMRSCEPRKHLVWSKLYIWLFGVHGSILPVCGICVCVFSKYLVLYPCNAGYSYVFVFIN